MDFPILIIWMSPFSFLGTSGVIFRFHFIFDGIHVGKLNCPRRFSASHLGLFCLSMSYKMDARLIWVKAQIQISLFTWIQQYFTKTIVEYKCVFPFFRD